MHASMLRATSSECQSASSCAVMGLEAPPICLLPPGYALAPVEQGWRPGPCMPAEITSTQRYKTVPCPALHTTHSWLPLCSARHGVWADLTFYGKPGRCGSSGYVQGAAPALQQRQPDAGRRGPGLAAEPGKHGKQGEHSRHHQPSRMAHRSSVIQAPRPRPYCSAGKAVNAAGANSSSRLTARHRSAADCASAPHSAASVPGSRRGGGVTHSSAGGPVSAMANLHQRPGATQQCRPALQACACMCSGAMSQCHVTRRGQAPAALRAVSTADARPCCERAGRGTLSAPCRFKPYQRRSGH